MLKIKSVDVNSVLVRKKNESANETIIPTKMPNVKWSVLKPPFFIFICNTTSRALL
ncbi:MAG: hypothetical protein QW468_02155 [Candidatus Bathyarchaeia archaeon]